MKISPHLIELTDILTRQYGVNLYNAKPAVVLLALNQCSSSECSKQAAIEFLSDRRTKIDLVIELRNQ